MLVFSLSPAVSFLLEGVIVGFGNFALGYKSHKKIKIGVNTNFGASPAPWVIDLLGFLCGKNEKCLELPEMARKLIVQLFKFLAPPPSQILALTNF